MTITWTEVHVGDPVRIPEGPGRGKVGIVKKTDFDYLIATVTGCRWYDRWEFIPLAESDLTAEDRDALAKLEKTEERTGE